MKTSKEWDRLPPQKREVLLKHQVSFPIKVGAIAEEFGIVVKKATLKPGVSGTIKETNGEVLVRINRHESDGRQRFTLAHEIAHFLLHREKIGDGIEDTMLFRSELSNSLEAEANRLAADIVMPFSLIDKISCSEEDSFEEKVERLAELARLSIPAIEVRLGKKGF